MTLNCFLFGLHVQCKAAVGKIQEPWRVKNYSSAWARLNTNQGNSNIFLARFQNHSGDVLRKTMSTAVILCLSYHLWVADKFSLEFTGVQIKGVIFWTLIWYCDTMRLGRALGRSVFWMWKGYELLGAKVRVSQPPPDGPQWSQPFDIFILV